ncbi:DUF1761 domain-containing protein [Maritalea sp.]|jgi:hypothetical protein|uniref:DUF1761 domain-containing protein n=1 Tax=Maritalea sp. TaxID=2003361 RepID=UPI0039E41823
MGHFADINWLAIVLATIASMALGMGWYTVLGKQWMTALGKTKEDLMPDGKGSPKPFIIAGICQLIMAYFLLLLTRAIIDTSAVDVQILDAVLVGAHMWFGFLMTGMILNHAYQGQKLSLTLIDGGYLLGIMIVQGVVLGLLA